MSLQLAANVGEIGLREWLRRKRRILSWGSQCPMHLCRFSSQRRGRVEVQAEVFPCRCGRRLFGEVHHVRREIRSFGETKGPARFVVAFELLKRPLPAVSFIRYNLLKH